MLARQRAVEALKPAPAHVLVDGKRRITGMKVPQTPVVEGDRLLPSIAAASIIAKVTRDRMMERLADLHPGYGFELRYVEAPDRIGAIGTAGGSPAFVYAGRRRGTAATGILPVPNRGMDGSEDVLLR
jgi:ribonuclease HII